MIEKSGQSVSVNLPENLKSLAFSRLSGFNHRWEFRGDGRGPACDCGPVCSGAPPFGNGRRAAYGKDGAWVKARPLKMGKGLSKSAFRKYLSKIPSSLTGDMVNFRIRLFDVHNSLSEEGLNNKKSIFFENLFHQRLQPR